MKILNKKITDNEDALRKDRQQFLLRTDNLIVLLHAIVTSDVGSVLNFIQLSLTPGEISPGSTFAILRKSARRLRSFFLFFFFFAADIFAFSQFYKRF